MWIAVRDPRVPWVPRVVGAVVVAYAFSPIDLIPDAVPVLGLVDDAVLVPAGVWLTLRLIPTPILKDARRRLASVPARPVSRLGAILVVATWIGGVLLAWRLWRGA